MTRVLRSMAAVALVFAAAACSDDSTSVDTNTPTAIIAVSGNAQQAQPGALLPGYLIVQVKDAEGHIVVGAPVTWTVTSGNGRIENATTTTDAYGRAIAAWVLGTQEGQQTVTVTVGGVSSPVVFTAIANGSVVIPK